nr:hypothetical protein [Ectobacillus funiculus]
MTEKRVYVNVEVQGERTVTEYDVNGKFKLTVVINNQFTNAPNTTQLASEAGRSSTAGNNAAIDSSNTEQQQSVGGQGQAKNEGMKGEQFQPQDKHAGYHDNDEIVFVINNQIHCSGETDAAATQVASGGDVYSAAGTNAAVESTNTKQQYAVGGDETGRAVNTGMNNKQIEKQSSFHEKQQQSIDGLRLFLR